MTPKQLRAFLAVAQTLSFVQACERVHLSQPALSLAIKALETSLGGALFVRSSRSVQLTPEGEVLLSLAPRLIADWDDARERMRRHFALDIGRVELAVIPSFACNLLPRALGRFVERHPRIDVAIHDVINERVLDMVRGGQVELGIAFEPIQLERLQFQAFHTDRFVAVVPPGSALASRARIGWETLLRERFIALQRPSAVRALLEQVLAERRMELRVAFECHQLATVGRMVAQGLGVSAVPGFCVPQMAELGACCRPLVSPGVQRRIGLLRRTDRQLSSAAQALCDLLLRIEDWGPEQADAADAADALEFPGAP
jgi:LysR family carnitine catabolism transcriptional activator